jgi:cytosine/adenosine deaminase-related metal-dependent hydrolase
VGRSGESPAFVIRNAALADGVRVDATMRDGRIDALAPAQDGRNGDRPPWHLDGVGRLLLPAFVVPDLHLDKVFFLAEVLARVEPEAARPGAARRSNSSRLRQIAPM